MDKRNPNRVTLKLGERVSAPRFRVAVGAFLSAVDAVATSMTGDPKAIQWFVSVEKGSQLINTDPELASASLRVVPGVGRELAKGIAAIENNGAIPQYFRDSALKHLRRLTHATAASQSPVTASIIVDDEELPITSRTALALDDLARVKFRDYGSIEGRIETVSKRGTPKFIVYDALTDAPVRCDVGQDLQQEALRAFGKRVCATGLVKYRQDGRPISVKVESLSRFPDEDELPTADEVYGVLSRP